MPRIATETQRAIIAAIAKGMAPPQAPSGAPGSADHPPPNGIQQRDCIDQPQGPAPCK